MDGERVNEVGETQNCVPFFSFLSDNVVEGNRLGEERQFPILIGIVFCNFSSLKSLRHVSS